MAAAREEELPAEAEQATGAGSFARDLSTSETQYSAGFRGIFAAPPELELDRDVLLERVHPDDRELIDESLELALRKRRPFSFEVRVRRFDEADRVIRVRGKLELGDGGQPRRLLGTIQDVTEDARERSARELLGYVVDSSNDAIITKQRDGTITSWNRGAERLYGWTAEEAIGQPIGLIEPVERAGERRQILEKVFGGESLDHLETERIRKDGTRLVVSLTISPVRDSHGEIVSAAIIARDITERTRYEQRLRHLADHDQLTGLFNRRRFDEELKRELARAGRYHSRGAVLSIDIDNFKSINDSAGHAAGDAVLSEAAGVLERRFRASDIVARIGGDEFAVLLPSVDVDEARAAAEDLLASIHGSKAVFGGKPLRITASIGVAAFESDDATAGELLTGADLAMYAAKAQGRDRVVVYTASEGRRARATLKLTWAERIREALGREHGFVLHLQPILELATGKMSHGELLLRMRGEHGDLIPPGAFLPAAERYGLIHAVDRWVVSHAIQMLAAATDASPPALGVNLSGESVVGDPQLLKLIERELWASSVDPAKLIFEITETAAIANMPEASAFADAVNELGASLALDDFGTGFGSFYYLKHLPVSYVKLDGEFIQNLPRSEIDAHMVSAIVRVARSMGIKTVAESVTDDETIRLLREHGVDFAQGFHVGRPGPIAEPSSN
jgi:diguanylate cyclase (GGDEF)-like protein/PAS domain S-box-containing protein